MAWIIFAFQLLHAAVLPQANSVQIRVRIGEKVPRVIVRGFDLRIDETQERGRDFGNTPGKTPAITTDKLSEWELRCHDGQIQAKALVLSGRPAKGQAASRKFQVPVSIQSPTGFLSYQEQPYRNELRILSRGESCEVINQVDIEKYLEGLVNTEFSSKWNEESIAAQVVAARTYAYYQLKTVRARAESYFDIDATVKDQVYNGAIGEDPIASRAVAKTRGLILVTQKLHKPVPLKAFYHSTCGGLTELPEPVWGGSFSGFKQRVSCPYCAVSPRYSWTLDVSTKEIETSLRTGLKGEIKAHPNTLSALDHGQLVGIQVARRSPGDRVFALETLWEVDRSQIQIPVTGVRLRDWMGPARLRSTRFQVTPLNTKDLKGWHFQGRGNGHGVGMCQWGAKVMGEKGHKMVSILKYYYPEASLQKMW